MIKWGYLLIFCLLAAPAKATVVLKHQNWTYFCARPADLYETAPGDVPRLKKHRFFIKHNYVNQASKVQFRISPSPAIDKLFWHAGATGSGDTDYNIASVVSLVSSQIIEVDFSTELRAPLNMAFEVAVVSETRSGKYEVFCKRKATRGI
jgi:hypothetical protein